MEGRRPVGRISRQISQQGGRGDLVAKISALGMRPALLAFLTLLALLSGAVQSSIGYACASCGSGSGNPLVLYPNEKLKAYAGFAMQNDMKRVQSDGSEGKANVPDIKQSMTAAIGYRPHLRLSLAVGIPYVTNSADKGARVRSDLGDPFVEARSTLLISGWDQPQWPQVQAIVGYKDAMATSIYESEDPYEGLDIHGNGFDELNAGLDFWWGMTPVKAGFAWIATHSFARDAKQVQIQRGLRQTVTGTIGFKPLTRVLVTSGVSRIQKGADQLDGDEVRDSQSLQHDAFLSTRVNPSPEREVKMTYVRTAFALQNSEALRSHSLSVGYARIF